MVPYFGDFLEDDSVYIPFNTFSSDDPSASVTITNLADADIHVHENGGTTQATTDGATVAIDFDGITGNHLVTIDTSADAFYNTGADYMVRMEGTTVDGATINAWIGSFSIENRAGSSALRPTVAGRTLDVTATGEAGVDFDNTSGTLQDADIDTIGVDVLSISGDSTAADNLELMYDGTGYTADTAPASREQVNNISSTGAAVNVSPLASPNGFVLTTGSEVNDEDSVVALDGTRHELSDAAGTLDAYYVFDVGSSDTPTSVTFTGVFNGSNDDFDIFVNTGSSGTPSWSQRGTLEGTGSSQNATHTFTLFSGDKLTDDSSRVWIRVQATGLTSSSFDVDQVFVSKSVNNQSVGYDDAAVWLNTTVSNTSTESFVDGVGDNPVSTIAAALTIAGNVGLSRVRVLPGSDFSLAASLDNYAVMGAHYNLDLGSQSISNASIMGATIDGGTITAATAPIFEQCIFDTSISLVASVIRESFLGDMTFTLQTGDYFINNCIDRADGVATPILDFGASVGNTSVNMHNYSGAVELHNFGDNGTDALIVSGRARVIINANSSGGTVTIVGNEVTIIDNSGAATITFQNMTDGIWRQFMDDGTTAYDRTSDSLQEIRDNLSGGAGDWTATEREQIRFRLAMDGTQTDPTTGTGTIEDILADVTGLNGDAMRGTDSANTTTPPTVAAIRAEMDSNSTQLAAIVADTNELQTDDVPGLIAALNDLSTADVNAQVLDVLNTDTFAEPTGVPAATVTLATKIGFLYMALRNQIDVTATKKTFYDDGGAAEWEKDLSDDGTTYSESEANAI